MAEKSESKEIREAIQAGEAALSSLRNAREKLNSAKTVADTHLTLPTTSGV